MNAENFISIDGHQLDFTPGETILDVAKRNNIFIPTLCHLPGTRPTGACRICVVEVEGARTLMSACTLPVTPKMVVHTHTPEVIRARRTILQLMLGAGHHNCAVHSEEAGNWTSLQRAAAQYDQSEELCEVYGACKLQALAYRYQVKTGQLAGRKPEFPLEDASALIVRDFSRCILCGRCVQACNDLQANHAISHGFRGAKAKIIAMGDHSLDRSNCVFCGACLQACPVGALVDKRSRFQIRPWEASHVRTTCGYCSVGCQLDLQIKDGQIQKVAGVEGALPSDGLLCARGRFGFDYLPSPQRLTSPLVRKNGKLEKASWEDALDLVADKIKEVRDAQGADAIGGICSARSTNEGLYSFQKLLRAVIGTHNVTAPFSCAPMTNSLRELEQTSCILLIGCDITEENPVAGGFVKRAAKEGRQLIVIDSRPTRIADFATLHLKPAQGTEAVLINGLIHQILNIDSREGSVPVAKIRAAKELAADFGLPRVSEATGVTVEDTGEAAKILSGAESVMLVYGPEVAAWAPAFTTLQELLGHMERAGGGVNAIGDLCNSQGAALMGVDPRTLPGYRDVADADARSEVAHAWRADLSAKPGLTFTEMMLRAAGAAEGHRIHLLYCAGEDLAVAQPVLEGAPRAIEDVGFLVVQDSFENETLAQADVVLPAAAWGEEDGTYTSCERRISRVRRAVDPPGEARSDIWIYAELARRLGASWPAGLTAQQIWEQEIAQLVPQVAGITYARIAAGGLQWPVADIAADSAPRLDGQRPAHQHPQWNRLNYHHRSLLERCEGLLESLALLDRPDAAPPESDATEIRRRFVAFLEQEEVTDKKPEVDALLATYRPRRGGLIPVLQKVQGSLGYLPVPVQNYIALGLGLSAADVFGVVSFYSFFTMIPRGRWTIRVCLGTACYVKQSGRILENVERHLSIKCGETTPDREFSLEAVRCVGACGLAPVTVIGEDTHGQVDPKKIAEMIESYRSMPS